MRARHIRLWQRDMDTISEVGRSPLLTGQIARLLFPTRKKAAERLLPLHQLGLLKRMAYVTPVMQGKPEYVYYKGSRPHERTLAHTILIAEVRVQVAQWLRATTDVGAEFYYGHEVPTSAHILPDAALVIHKAAKTGLFFVEGDNGTEVITSPTRYSLAKKLAAYATYFDTEAYVNDFAWAGTLRGFRVGLIVPAGRLRFVQHLVAQQQHDFVLTTTFDRLKGGLGQAVWLTHTGNPVDLLGRPREMTRDLPGEMVRTPLPTTAGENA